MKIRNLSAGPVEVSGHTIPSNGSLVLPYVDYVKAATEQDLSGLRLDVPIRNVERNDVSVSDFGAVGDGITDDTRPVQRAIDYVRGYGGGTVGFPAGMFVVDGVDASGVTVRLDSDMSVIKAVGAGYTNKNGTQVGVVKLGSAGSLVTQSGE